MWCFTNGPSWYSYAPMENNLRSIREKMGLTLDQLAEMMGTSQQQLSRLEKGERRLSDVWLRRYEKVGISYLRIFGNDKPPKMVMVLGKIGAGAMVYPVDDHAKNSAGLEEVACPYGEDPEKIVALRVVGDSMEPALQDGDIIYYTRRAEGIEPDAMGNKAVVKLTNDAVLVKKLKAGSKPGKYHLFSINNTSDPILDATLVWAAKVAFIKPS
jgi:phage repressor protein C with HTH and peptisase S24 domain